MIDQCHVIQANFYAIMKWNPSCRSKPTVWAREIVVPTVVEIITRIFQPLHQLDDGMCVLKLRSPQVEPDVNLTSQI